MGYGKHLVHVYVVNLINLSVIAQEQTQSWLHEKTVRHQPQYACDLG